jgi:hypothetical protein
MSLNVKSGQGQSPTFVISPAAAALALAAISATGGTTNPTSVSVSNVPGTALAKFNGTAQNALVVEVLNVPGRALATLIADPNFVQSVDASRPTLAIGGTGFIHVVDAETVDGEFSQADMNADWLTRVTDAGNIWGINFTDVYLNGARNATRSAAVLTSQGIRDDSQAQGVGEGEDIERVTNPRLSGTGAVDALTFDTTANGDGSYNCQQNGVNSSYTDAYYLQFAVHYPRDTIAWCYPISSSTTFKIMNCGTPGGGQVVPCIDRFQGFPGLLINQTQNASQAVGSTFASSNGAGFDGTGIRIQNAIDTNPGGATPTTKAGWLNRYGYVLGWLDDDMDIDDADPPSQWLYDRTHAGFGWPDTRAAVAGVPIEIDGWTTFELYIDRTGLTLQMWMAPYGQAPIKVWEAVGTAPISGATSERSEHYFLNYDTQREPEPGVRPSPQHTYFSEIIFSTNPIPFPNPGGTPFDLDEPVEEPETALSIAAAGLSAGQSVIFTGSGLTSANTANGNILNWQTRAHYDQERQLVRFMGKRQVISGTTDARHIVYDELTHSWQASGDLGFPLTGHIYDAVGYDEDTGDFWNARYASDRVRRWVYGTALNAFIDPATSDPNTGITSIMANGTTFTSSGTPTACWHPNMYGAGDHGLVVLCNEGAGVWRKNTNTWHVLVNYASSTPGTLNRGVALYVKGLGASIITIGGDLKAWRIDDGPVVTAISNTPQNFGHATTGAAVIDDPNEGPTCYALEKNITNQRVWKLVGGSSWVLQSFTHPFSSTDSDQINWVGTACYGLGVIWGLERDNNTIRGTLWKPNS